MIEDQLPDRFRAALSDEPPLGFDPDEVVDRAARLHQRRATVIAASAAAATVVLAAVTALQVVRADDAEVAGFGSAATSEPTKPSCEPKPTGTRPTETTPLPTESTPLPSESEPYPSESEPFPSESTPFPTESSEWPTESSEPPIETTPSAPEFPETKTIEPTEPKPPETRPTNPKPIKPTPTKPLDPCAPIEKPSPKEPFTGWEQIIEQLRKVTPQVLAERVPGLTFVEGGWKPDPGQRCVHGTYHRSEDKGLVVSFTVCHNQKTGVDRSTPVDGLGSPQGETQSPDGSLRRLHRVEDGDRNTRVAAAHHRTDGVVVLVGTGYAGKPEPQVVVFDEQLTAMAGDGRLTF